MLNRYPKYRWLPYMLLTLTVLFWAGNFVLGRGIRDLIPPVSLNFWRWVGALIILLPLAVPRIQRQWPLVVHHWKYLALMSVPAIAIFNAFIYLALQTTTATNTVLVNAMIPVFIGLMSWLAYNETMGPQQIVGVMISLAGLLFIVSRGHLGNLARLGFSSGDLWTLAAGMAWAFYSVMLRKRPIQMDPIAFLTAIVALGLLVMLPFYFWELSIHGGFNLSKTTLGSIAYVCVFPSVLSFIFWNRGVAMVGANRAGIFFHLMPVFSILLAFIFLNEQPRLFHLTGVILIFTGIALTTLARKKR